MCGICGSTCDPGAVAVRRMCRAMVHRGPDDEGCIEDPKTHATLGARRLSVIDVAGGHQPVANEDASVWAVLNGEIYNHQQLQRRLRDRGHVLASRSDTEVLVHLYEDYGDALVHALEGMYAFALWDRRRQRLLLARDRFGEKPLFYREQAGGLVFASELSALARGVQQPLVLDAGALDDFFVLGYIPGQRTPLRGVRQLPPAHLLSWRRDDPTARITRYWSAPARAEVDARSTAELVAELEALMRAAVRSRLIADVPVGVFLSGGLDSTLVTALAREAHSGTLQSFTVTYDVGAVGEHNAARAIAERLGTDHREVCVRQSEVQERVQRVLGAIDAPCGDQALIALEAVAQSARCSVTVAVGGEGADELFAGYPRYRWLERAERLDAVLPRKIGAAAAGALRSAAGGARARRLAEVLDARASAERHLDWVSERRRHLRAELYGPRLRDAAGDDHAIKDAEALLGEVAELSADARFMELDRQRWLPDNVLMKADRASMLNSLEVRTPFLDRTLSEFAASIPVCRHSAGDGKSLLRLLHRKLTGSSRAPTKTAFRVPSREWLAGPLGELLDHHVNDGRLVAEGWFSRPALRQVVAEHRTGRDRSAALWPILALGIWLEGAGRDYLAA